MAGTTTKRGVRGKGNGWLDRFHKTTVKSVGKRRGGTVVGYGKETVSKGGDVVAGHKLWRDEDGCWRVPSVDRETCFDSKGDAKRFVEVWVRRNPAKSVSDMSAGEINKALDNLDKESSKLTQEFIDAGRGHERPSEYLKMTDPLAMRARRQSDEYAALNNEKARRYGPGAPSRLPKGFGPTKKWNPAKSNPLVIWRGFDNTAAAEHAKEILERGDVWAARARGRGDGKVVLLLDGKDKGKADRLVPKMPRGNPYDEQGHYHQTPEQYKESVDSFARQIPTAKRGFGTTIQSMRARLKKWKSDPWGNDHSKDIKFYEDTIKLYEAKYKAKRQGKRNPGRQLFTDIQLRLQDAPPNAEGIVKGNVIPVGQGTPVEVLRKKGTRVLVHGNYTGREFCGWVDKGRLVDKKTFIAAHDWDPTQKQNPKGKRNPAPAAAEMYEKFHGRESGEVVEVEEREHYHGHLAALGVLVEIKVKTVSGYRVEIGFAADGAGKRNPKTKSKVSAWLDRRGKALTNVGDSYLKSFQKTFINPKDKRKSKRNAAATGYTILATNEAGNQLYIEGGDQSLDLGAIHMAGKWERDSMVIGDILEITYRTEKDFDKFESIDYFHKLGEDTGALPQLRYDAMNQKLYIDGGQYFIKKPVFGTSPGIEN